MSQVAFANRLLWKATDPTSGRTVTFGETAHKRVHALPHLWASATPSAVQRMGALLRNFLGDLLQALLTQTNIFCVTAFDITMQTQSV